MTLKPLFLTCLTFGILISSFGQQIDFDLYQTLESKGAIPADFNTSTLKKIETDLKIKRENLSTEEQKDFLEKIHSSVDELLQSGKITYGDEISMYVSKVAQNLLKDDPELYGKLRFYTVKSNITNALSTDQGIILVTTGLMSQLTSEAELAYVLSHEIIHYKEKHAVEWFELSKNDDVIHKMQEMSVYSQEREFEADAKGIDLYLKAGYSKEQLTTLFDVLAYSYLPVDEIPFPVTYFNSTLCEIPKKKFPKDKFDIKLDENYDDRRSTHPNIKRRKTKALETADSLENWGTQTNIFGEEEFYKVRDIARYERLRTDMLDHAYDEALYTLFLLEQKNSTSTYLNRMKCQAWYGLTLQKAAQGEFFDAYYNEEDDFGLEGEIATLKVFLKRLSAIETATLAARVVHDCKNNCPDDPEIANLWERTMKQLIHNRQFNFEDFSDVPYEEYVRRAKEEADSMKHAEISKTEFERMTKYQKIRNKRKVAKEIAILDSTNYYLYNISDLITDSAFIQLYQKNKDKVPADYGNDEYSDYDDYREYDMTKKERRALKKERKKDQYFDDQSTAPIDFSEIIIVDPYALYYDGEDIDTKKSDELLATLTDVLGDVIRDRKLVATTLGRGNMEDMTTAEFNQKGLYLSLLDQLNQYRGERVFAVDYSAIQQLENTKENRKIVFLALVDNYVEDDYYRYEKKNFRERTKDLFQKDMSATMYLIVVDPKAQKILLQERSSFKNARSKNLIRENLEILLDTRVSSETEEEWDESENQIPTIEE